MKLRLGVNIDHVATLRQARRGKSPDPIEAALVSVKAGADSIVCHLREDARHIQPRDVFELKKRLSVPLNLEMSLAPAIVATACRVRPTQATLVPERRQEITTEGGLDVVGQTRRIRRAVETLQAEGIAVSLFVDPHLQQLKKVTETGARIIELHTGTYANARTARARKRTLTQLQSAARWAAENGLTVAAGHGLDLANVAPVARIQEIEELNIGHSIIAHAVFVGLARAVREMRRQMITARKGSQTKGER